MLEALLVAHVLGKKEPPKTPTFVVSPGNMVLDTNALHPPWQGARTALIVVLVVLELILFVCAVFRALKCSQGNPDSRALHLLFATVSPALYLIFSFAVDGFCKPSVK